MGRIANALLQTCCALMLITNIKQLRALAVDVGRIEYFEVFENVFVEIADA
jgi:hypothetical protein